MSRNAHIPSHRKPRSSKSRAVLSRGCDQAASWAPSPSPRGGLPGRSRATRSRRPPTTRRCPPSARRRGLHVQGGRLPPDHRREVRGARGPEEGDLARPGSRRRRPRRRPTPSQAQGRRGPREGRRRGPRLPLQRAHTLASVGSGNVAGLVSFLKAQVGKSYVHGRQRPLLVRLLRPDPGRVQAGRRRACRASRRTSPRTAPRSPSTPSSPATSCTGAARAARTTWACTSAAASSSARRTPPRGVVERPLSYDQPSGAVRLL